MAKRLTNVLSKGKKSKKGIKKVEAPAESGRAEISAAANKLAVSTTGKRKTAVAQIKFSSSGQGKILINNKTLQQYFSYPEWQQLLLTPLKLTGQTGKCDIIINLNGGGMKSQAEACRLGISRALVQLNSDFRKILKSQGLLTRDARVKERKKPGLKRARRAPQWQKR